MNKILSSISAGLLVLLAVSCQKDEKVMLDTTRDVKAPVLVDVTVDDGLVVNYTPAQFTMTFNEKMPFYHTLGLHAINGEACNVTLSNAKDDGISTIKITGKNLNTFLVNRGFEMGNTVTLDVVVRASIQDPSKGVTNGYVDSEAVRTVEYTLEETTGSVVLPVHEGVRIYADDQTGWDALTLYMWGDTNDFGGGWPGKEVTGTVSLGGVEWKYFEYGEDIFGLAENLIFNNNGGGTQLADYPISFEAGVADYWLTITADGVAEADAPSGDSDPYAAFTEESSWSVIGSIASTGNSWNQDEAMLSDGEWHICIGITLATTDQFKFRFEGAWDVNVGATDDVEPFVVALDEEYVGVNGGKNLAVPEDGVYDLLLNPDEWTYKVVKSTVKADPVTPPVKELPNEMYMIGEAFGNWNWASDDVVEMIPVNGKKGQFWAIRYIAAGSPFKFAPGKAWSGDFTGLGEDSGYAVSDNNCVVDKDGVYMIYVDADNKKLCVEPARVYGAGNSFGGKWGAEDEALLFQEDGMTLVATTTGESTLEDGGLRMWAASSIATSEWWTREFIFFDGKIAYRGTGGDQDRVAAHAGQKIVLNFNEGTAVLQ